MLSAGFAQDAYQELLGGFYEELQDMMAPR